MSLDFYPRFATGPILFALPDGEWLVNGTGAMYMRGYVVLTAAHCIPDVEGGRFGFRSPMEPFSRVAEQVIRHPTIDLAALVISKDTTEHPNGVYSDIGYEPVDGGDFVAFGYPAEENTQVGRLFKGHYQRHFEYQNPSGRNYFAAELSIPAPAGLSGGPVSNAHRPQVLDAIVTTNHDSSLIIDSYEKVEHNGNISRSEIKRVVSYGIAAMLVPADVQAWVRTPSLISQTRTLSILPRR